MPIGEWIADFFTSPGPGGIVVIIVIILAAVIYTRLTRWILLGGEEKETRQRNIR